MLILAARPRLATVLGTGTAVVLGTALVCATLLVVAAASGGGPAAARWQTVAGVLLGTATTVACFVTAVTVSSTATLSLALRRRELALLRLTGATPGQVRRLVLGQSLVIGAAGSVVGAACGPLLVPVLVGLIARSGLVAARTTVPVTWWPPAVACGAGLLLTVLGVWSAVRRAGRIGPLEALREADVDHHVMSPGRWAAGGLALVVAAQQAVTGDPVSGDEALTGTLVVAICLITGAALLSPVLVPPLLRLLAAPLVRRTATGDVVRQSAAASVRRTTGAATPALVTMGLAVSLAGTLSTVTGTQVSDLTHAVSAPVVVLPDGAIAQGGGVPEEVVQRVAALPEAEVAAQSRGEVFLRTGPDGGTERRAALGVDPAGWAAGMSITTESGDLGRLTLPGTVAVTASGAADLGLTLGDHREVAFPDGTVHDLRVVAVLAEPSQALQIPQLLVDRALLRAHDPDAVTQAVLVHGATEAEVSAQVAGSEARVGTGAAWADGIYGESDRANRLLLVLVAGLSLLYTVLSLASSLVMATATRGAEVATLRLAGATRGQAVRAVAAEVALAVLAGAGMGLAAAALALAGLRRGLSGAYHQVVLALPWDLAAWTGATCLVVAVAAAGGTGWAITRGRSLSETSTGR